MSTMRLDFVSQDHLVLSCDVEEVIAPGSEGEMAVLPHHAPLVTVLNPGQVTIRCAGQPDRYVAISGGWMEVRPDHISILAHAAEQAEEIDLTRAEAARARAEELLAQGVPRQERDELAFALRRSQIRVKVARRHQRGGDGGHGGPGGGPVGMEQD
jgi:F-type H+-transporting ATPase subunit epsilon